MSRKEDNLINIVVDLKERHGFKYISGRFYKDNKQIPDNNYIRYFSLNKEFKDYLFKYDFKTDKDYKDLMECFIKVYGEDNKPWPDSELITKAKIEVDDYNKLRAEVDKIYNFTDKQLVLLNKLLFDNTNERSLFIITGIGGSGKSTFGNIVCQLFKDDVSYTSLDKLQGFELAPAVKKKLIYSDELGSNTLDNGNLKILASKQYIQVNNKYGMVETFKTQSNLLFCCNKLPAMDITDSGLLRRICYYHMNTKIKNPDPTMNRKEYTEDELIKIATLAYNTKIDDTWFEDNFQEETRYLLYNDSKINKVKQYLIKNGDLECFGTLTYALFAEGCKLMNLKPYSEPVFNELMEVFNSWEEEENQPKKQSGNVYQDTLSLDQPTWIF